ncbi:DUF4411 family protein [Corynebacterium sp. L4756]|uniref:DUF4411 family protein n=1 Tax=unclassified Corynebacterium TaxID=2624378 RepID=UPI00374D0E4F
MKFLVDTNFLGTLVGICPPDIFPTLWSQLETKLFREGVYFHEAVHDEQKAWKHPQSEWYLKHIGTEGILKSDADILAAYADVSEWALEREKKQLSKSSAVDEFLNSADSWLVAAGVSKKATIVTQEVRAPDARKRIKIPDVADAFGVPCIGLVEFLRALEIRV